MKTIVIEGNAVYEVDEECMKKKEKKKEEEKQKEKESEMEKGCS